MYLVAAFDNQNEAPEIQYHDSLGRKIRHKTQGFDNEVVYHDTEYDETGRAYRVSNKYFKDKPHTKRWKTVAYDHLDRAYQTTGYDGRSASVRFEGLATVTTNALGQQTRVEKNLAGQVKTATDNLGQVTHYEYDVRGNLLKTTDPHGNEIHNTYDHWGRKVRMDDPDMGVWTYRFDALGRLVEQTDAKGQRMQMSYDALGRMVKRVEAEGTSTWTYGVDTTYGTIAIGQLVRETFTGRQSAVTSYNKTFKYDSMARLASTTVTINGESYTTELGYVGQDDKLDHVTYPSGLTVRKEYTSTGFPKQLTSLDYPVYSELIAEQAKLTEAGKALNTWREISLDNFEANQKKVAAAQEQMQKELEMGNHYIELADANLQKYNQHQKLVEDYYKVYEGL